METINQDNLQAISNEAIFFKHNNFNLWNINEFKKPINISTNFGLTEWSKYNLEDFNKLRVDLTKNIGFLSGYQYKTKQFIIVLDFDIFSKKKKNDTIVKLYDNFSIIDYPKNISKKGHYNSSTCGNKGVILDITEYPEFISYLQSFKVAKIGGGLEILISNNVILPPSITVCKNCNTSQHNRKFIDEIGIAKLTPETECFIRLYIDDFKKHKPNSHQIRDTKNAKHGIIHYSNIINEDDDDNKPTYECILKLVKQCLKTVINDEYQGWFFITSSLINSYGNSIDNYNLYDIICKTVNNYDKEDNLIFWNTTNVSKYECYNYKAIINASYFYDQLTTYCILGEEYKRIEKEKEAAETQKQYSKWKLEFEKTHAKIISPLNFLDIINGEVEFISQTELKQRYAEKGEFINIWLKDDTKRIYQKIIFKPDAKDEDNKENYNLFNGFRTRIMLGNKNISSPIDSCWLNNTLKISPDEQLGLVKKLYFDQLPFRKSVQQMVRDLMLQEKNTAYQLSYKTGSGFSQDGNAIGWLVGWLEENKHVYFFVSFIKSPLANTDTKKVSIQITKSILKQYGFFEGKK